MRKVVQLPNHATITLCIITLQICTGGLHHKLINKAEYFRNVVEIKGAMSQVFISKKTLHKVRENHSFETVWQKRRRDEKNHETNGVAGSQEFLFCITIQEEGMLEEIKRWQTKKWHKVGRGLTSTSLNFESCCCCGQRFTTVCVVWTVDWCMLVQFC